MLNLTDAIYQQPGKRQEYRLSDGSAVVELPVFPSSSRWQFWNNLNHRVFSKSSQAAIKAAVERYKKRWRCK